MLLFKRDLYDFFDEQGIYIWIEKAIDVHSSGYEDWQYVIVQDVWTNDTDSINYKTRIEAEEKAFEKAFELLENKVGE